MLLVDAAHKCCSRRQHLIDVDEDSLLWRQLDALANHIDELRDREIGWDQVLLLVNRLDVRLLDRLADDLSTSSAMFLILLTSNILEYGRCTSA